MDTEKEMRLQAENITCSSCAGDMEKILMDTDGVLSASVNFGDETVYVRYNPRIIDRKKVFFAVRNLWYDVRIISES